MKFGFMIRPDMMTMHAFICDDKIPAERMHVSALRRLRLLGVRLIEDLQTGRKIFVVGLSERILSDGEICQLHAALRPYGPNTLL